MSIQPNAARASIEIIYYSPSLSNFFSRASKQLALYIVPKYPKQQQQQQQQQHFRSSIYRTTTADEPIPPPTVQ